MSMSSCIKCWDNPCRCGWDYRNWSQSKRIEHASVVLGIDEGVLKSLIYQYVPTKHPLFDPAKINEM